MTAEATPTSEVPRKVASTCRTTAELAEGAIEWFRDNETRVGLRKDTLIRTFRNYKHQARKLESACERPMCVSVYGPSQAGKSYLISVLARPKDGPLMAKLDGEMVGYVEQINPEGGQEATGLVTRFTIHPIATPQGFPVALRLLSRTDVIKILGNTYFSDLDLSDEESPTPESVKTLFEELAGQTGAPGNQPILDDEIFELQEYFAKHFRGEAGVQVLGHANYWHRAADIAPQLDVEGLARLFAPLWGGIEEFNRLFKTLYTGLAQLGFADDAFCPKDALVPRAGAEQRPLSILDVRTLFSLGVGGTSSVMVRSCIGAAASLPRPVVTALAAELQLVMQDCPWPFFKHTDLLDFPGARPRERVQQPRLHVKKAGELGHLYLRGKVAYLLERYCAEQELTSMLLCLGPSNQNVPDLPNLIRDWVFETHGKTPEDRLRNETALYLVLTKFDTDFDEKKGQSEESGSPWTARIESAITNFLRRAAEWPDEWHPGKPFNNVYWLRNPNYKAEKIIDYDDWREVGIRPGKVDYIERLRREYLDNELVRKYFAQPERAWEAGLELNDGGVNYLATSLEPVCRPEIKRQQIEERIGSQRRAMRDELSRFFVGGDMAAQKAVRQKAAVKVVRELGKSAEQQKFGQLLSLLQAHEDDFADIFYEVQTLAGDAGEIRTTVGPVTRLSELEAVVFGSDALFNEEEPAPGAAAEEASVKAPKALDIADHFAQRALEHWIAGLHDLGARPEVRAYFGLSERTAQDLTAELIAGTRRLDLQSQLAQQVRRIVAFRQHVERAAATPAKVAANAINDFVNQLGLKDVSPDARPRSRKTGRSVFVKEPPAGDRLQLPEVAKPYEFDEYVDWFTAYVHLVDSNASTKEGQVVDVAANDRIGALINRLATAG